ncbi:hypothetical protein HK104_001426 [Borealophlyctis nickersoniae]|nr:hypothetical protein HK104_001426 [Borealophlyctis nickersoniae]
MGKISFSVYLSHSAVVGFIDQILKIDFRVATGDEYVPNYMFDRFVVLLGITTKSLELSRWIARRWLSDNWLVRWEKAKKAKGGE